MKALRGFLTRDMPLLAVESWYEGKERVAKKFFGFEQPARAFMHLHGVFKYYSDMEGFDIQLPRKISRWIHENPDKIHLIYDILKEGLDYFDNLPKISSSESFIKTLGHCKNLFSRGYVGILVAHHVPRWNDEFRQRGEKLFDDLTIKTVLGWREKEGNVFFARGNASFYSLIEIIAKDKGWDPTLLKYITEKELHDCVCENRQLPIEILHKRMNDTFVYFNYKIFYEPEIEGRMKKLGYVLVDEKISSDIKELKGTVASPGKVRGPVKIVFTKNDLHKVEKGDVIVSPMTSDNMILPTVSAIVTDEGGITCHAAIVSRELNKPCIIGTKIATQVFKDGDEIEVDAEKGVVRKLKNQPKQ